MINLCSSKHTHFFGSHSCDCGVAHEFPVRCLLEKGAFCGAADFVREFTPFLSRIAILYDDDEILDEVQSSLKRDFRVTCIEVSDKKKEIERVVLPPDTKLIVAVGSHKAINSAKYKAYLSDLPLIVAALPDFGAFAPYCVIDDGGQYATYAVCSPKGYIFDSNVSLTDGDKVALFGQIAARLNSSFEYYVYSLVSRGTYCPFLAGATSDIAAKTVLAAEQVSFSSPAFNDILLESSLKLALISSALPTPFWGEVQCALSYGLLTGEKYSQGELQFVFAAVLTSLYISHLSNRRSFTPPPDNNYRLEQISALFGIGEHKAIRQILTQISGLEAAIIEYKFKEYSVDLLEKLNKNANLFKKAFRTFKRLYCDGGYSLSAFFNNDVSLCIALAPDLIYGGGMLNALKRLGELDCYIV